MNLQRQTRTSWQEKDDTSNWRLSGSAVSPGQEGDNGREDCVRLSSGPSVAARLRSVWVPKERSSLPLGLQSWGNLQSWSCQGPKEMVWKRDWGKGMCDQFSFPYGTRTVGRHWPSRCQWSRVPPSPQSLWMDHDVLPWRRHCFQKASCKPSLPHSPQHLPSERE